MTTDATAPLRIVLNALHLAFLALLVLGVGTAAARAACAGTDLRSQLERERPGALGDIARAVESTPNGQGRLWRVEAPDGAVSHLYGTMHVTDQAVVALGPEARAAHEKAETVVIETTAVLDPQASAAQTMSRPDLVFYLDGSNLLDLVPDAEEPALDRALQGRGLSLAAVKSLKPWMLMAQLSVPACAVTGGEGLDVALARGAQERGDAVAGLETLVEQLSAIATLPVDLQVAALMDAARIGESVDDLYATMGALYREGEIAAIWPTLNALSEMLLGETMDAADQEALIAFEEAVVLRRNRVMAERAGPFLDQGEAFIAVGALHLPGEEGLIALLRNKGYGVERVAM